MLAALDNPIWHALTGPHAHLAIGRGAARRYPLDKIRAVLARGETPILHVWPDNPAKALYAAIGFRLRATLWLLWRRPTQ
jgi:hypothetical protein